MQIKLYGATSGDYVDIVILPSGGVHITVVGTEARGEGIPDGPATSAQVTIPKSEWNTLREFLR